ncbi:cbb3-type cytochrome c oxidase subunit I [Aneurinibacillus thermoaerophilus]|uniref:cbb3-type cytochrome c oxidase subunit I n=1 Tax=Aneurinibacillus thermoaerophilus TaxID=143495 RepID=UPI002E1BF78F|nr:cbb3-type cytochrome c oxidase subunit I [Aneurinibacillus thermoaerophilus]MED0677464.1 cbb3-type cytochrome c oxidase subunit I [Aneurinibacillus thermoaerophilus]
MAAITSYENKAVRFFFYSSLAWLIVGMIIGLILAIKYVWPDFLVWGAFLQKYLSYGRIRPVHTHILIFGWLSMAYVAGLLYVIPQLTRKSLEHPRFVRSLGVIWNVYMILAIITLSMGYTTTIEYAETVWPLDLLLIVLVAGITYACFKTIAKRNEKQLYVSLWYFMGSLIWLPFLYIIGNIVTYFISGVPQALAGWFYGHNIIGLWLTTVGVGFIYYLLPLLSKNPLYSHKLSLIGFWTIATFYVWNGPHHLQNGPIPAWLMKAGVVPSVLLIIPVWTVLANVFGTMKGKWHVISENVPLKFVVTGAIFYLITCLQGPFQSLMQPSAILKFTNWIIGHAHMPLFAAFSFVLFALFYYALPTLTGRKIYSQALMNWHFWLSVIGFLIFAFTTWTAGVMQGFAWAEGKQYGVPFLEVVISLQPFSIARAIGGTLMFTGQLIFIYNVRRSLKDGQLLSLEEKSSSTA